MNKYCIISAVLTPDPDYPTMGVLRRRELFADSKGEAQTLCKNELVSMAYIHPTPVGFKIRLRELGTDNRYHTTWTANY